MSTAIEHRSTDGTATLTDTHLVFDYSFRARIARSSKRSEIPLSKITAFDVIPGKTEYLRVSASGWSATPDPSRSALAFALDPSGSSSEFLEALRSATGAEQQHIEVPSAPVAEAPARLPSADFGGYKLRDGVLKGGGKSVSVQGAEAEATQGAPSQRSTLTRMGAGALIAGPIGFVVGAVARKNTSKCYVTIEVPDGVIIIEAKAKEYRDAVEFASAVNRSAAAVR
ncbi:hypothetical protein [Microbacterium sp. USHLN272]|uniref:hypothetical protein n=1 Tax=Microbacterium sp. USHLN272 TaxID=3081287 RepID=UPI00301B6610